MKKLLYLLLLISFMGCRKKEMYSPPPPPVYTPIQLNSSSFVLGNLQKGIEDTFSLRFNKPVKIKYIRLISDYCQPDLEYKMEDDSTTIKFYKLLCSMLGKDYLFEFSVQDREGKVLTDSATFSYYLRKLPVEGEIITYRISSDNQYCWITTSAPNRIYCIGLEDSTYRKVYDLDFKPGKIAVNPYNQKFYILSYPNYNTNTDKIYVMNPDNGHIDKVMTVTKDQYDDPEKNITINNLEFGYNGYGVLLTGTKEYGQSRWRILDSRFNDSIYVHPEWVASTGSGNYFFNEFVNVQANYNKTKLYLKELYSKPRMGVLDINTQSLTEVTLGSTNPNHYFVSNKVSDKLFVASFLYQSILDNGNWKSPSQFDDRYSETADFSYRHGDQNVIYYRGHEDNYEFMILDYNREQILNRVKVPYNFSGITSTTDGNYILAKSGNELILYDTNIFYKYL